MQQEQQNCLISHAQCTKIWLSAPAVVCSVSGAPTTSQWGPCACAVEASTSAGDPLMCSSPISAEMV